MSEQSLNREAITYGPMNVYCNQLIDDVSDLASYLPNNVRYLLDDDQVEHISKLLVEIKLIADNMQKQLSYIKLDNEKIKEQFPHGEYLSEIMKREKGMS